MSSYIQYLNRIGYDTTKPSIILDIGSRDCGESLELARAFPNARIFAFECNPQTLPLCRKAAENCSAITLCPYAVNSYDGECTFYPIDPTRTRTTWADGNPGASSLFKANGNYEHETYVQNEIQVPCRRIESVLKELGVDHVDLIWMDLQGAELIALQSMESYLDGVHSIHTEVTHRAMYTGQNMFSDIHTFLLGREFVANSPITGGWQQDVIYKNTRF